MHFLLWSAVSLHRKAVLLQRQTTNQVKFIYCFTLKIGGCYGKY